MILLIEDDVVSRHIIAALLARLRRTHHVARDVTEALDALALAPVELVIVDLAIPDAESVALLDELRADPRMSGVPALLCTARTDPAALDRATATGMTELVRKPIDVAQLAEAVSRALV